MITSWWQLWIGSADMCYHGQIRQVLIRTVKYEDVYLKEYLQIRDAFA